MMILFSMSAFLEFPIAIVQRANMALLQPTENTVEMKSMVTRTPSNGAFFIDRSLICLALDAGVHDEIPANCTGVNCDVPRPEGDGSPFRHCKSFLIPSALFFSLFPFHLRKVSRN